MTLGWDHSAPGWIAAIGTDGDATRLHIMDAPVMAALPDTGRLLDIGCGEGRMCRRARAAGLDPVGVEPTAALRAAAEARDPEGTYLDAAAEALPLDNASFDAALFYLSLIDIEGYVAAISEAARVVRPGGRLVAVNLTETVTARPRNWTGTGNHWVKDAHGTRLYLAVDDIQTERAIISAWGDIRIENYHRPVTAYMTAFLDAGLILRRFDSPPYTGPDPVTAEKYKRMPWANLMVWDKPEETT